MAENQDKTSTRLKFRTYKVGRSQLDRVITIATEGFKPEQISFKTTRSGTTFKRRTLEELISAIATSPLPGDPEIWSDLSIDAFDHQRNRSVSVDFRDYELSVWISGTDATWVHGQNARIRALLEPVANEQEEGSPLVGCSGAACGALVWVVAFLLTQKATEAIPVWGSILVATTAGLLALRIVLTYGGDKEEAEKRLLNVVGEVSDRGWWESRSMQDKIALAGAAIAAIAAIAALMSAYADVWGKD
ncbi:hypothetical protein [Streptomyces werraensis]|uniref:hypothetical protein n=1 Tax=Streptomyces werraensis TaxID=68284 RepID=UPI003416E473